MWTTIERDIGHDPLLLVERALSRDFPCKMWSSENQYLTASQSKGG